MAGRWLVGGLGTIHRSIDSNTLTVRRSDPNSHPALLIDQVSWRISSVPRDREQLDRVLDTLLEC